MFNPDIEDMGNPKGSHRKYVLLLMHTERFVNINRLPLQARFSLVKSSSLVNLMEVLCLVVFSLSNNLRLHVMSILA